MTRKKIICYAMSSEEPRIAGENIVKLETGTGGLNASQAVSSIFGNFINNPGGAVVISIGVAGLLGRNSSAIGDVVVCSPIYFRLLNGIKIVPEPKLLKAINQFGLKTLPDITIPEFRWLLRNKEKFVKSYPGEVIVEMENFHLAMQAKKARLPFIPIRIISDYGDKLPSREEVKKLTAKLEKDFLTDFVRQLNNGANF